MTELKSKFTFTKKTAIWAIIAAAVVIAAIVMLCSGPAQGDINTLEGRICYLEELGWQVDSSSEEREIIVLPRSFDGVMSEYNKLQLAQGYDLERFSGMECARYTYRVTNYPNGDPNVLAQLFICGSKVIGGDIHSAALDGFMHGLK